jgi:hypothetical protein
LSVGNIRANALIEPKQGWGVSEWFVGKQEAIVGRV